MIKLEEWLYPRGSQNDCSFFSKEKKQESKQIEDSSPEGATIRNQASEGAISTMVVIRWSYAIKAPIVKVEGALCGGLYKEDHGSIVTLSGTDPYSNLN